MDLDLIPTPSISPDDTEIDTPPPTHTSRNYCRRSPPPLAVAYKECMKNHAASIGGHAVDGCGEYMPARPSADPASLTCAACGCHRNFHRRQPESPTAAIITPPFLDFRLPPQAKLRASSSISPPSPPFQLALLAEERHQEPATPTGENPGGRKRFRTKFSQKQKEKMQSFSEKIGWKMQKSDEAAVGEFCHEIGVSKGVLKVWMHNNKNTFCKKETIDGKLSSINGGNNNIEIEEIRSVTDSGSHFQNESGNRVYFHHSNNYRPSSSP